MKPLSNLRKPVTVLGEVAKRRAVDLLDMPYQGR